MRTRRSAASLLSEADGELARRAMGVLDGNRLGDITRPSRHLYPHQWSWDSAFIAMAYARYDQAQAERELRALFAGQWRNGLVPHIVFADGGGPYFPGPDFWQTHTSPDAPKDRKTSGIGQPPVHATAVLRVYRHASDRAGAAVFLKELLPKLSAWHSYLHRERSRGNGLVEIWHPWESGMDNSPLWDEALERITPASGDRSPYPRTDLTFGDASERPSDAEYDRYAYLVALFRDHRYDPARIRAVCPFVIQHVLFNAVLVQADRDLAEIARVLGEDPRPFEARADKCTAGLQGLWDSKHETYVDYDVRADAPVPTWTAAGFTPLYAGVPDPERAAQMVAALVASSVTVGDRGFLAPSLPPDDPRFAPNLYWRGPVWPVINWLLSRGLARYGYLDEAAQVRSALLDLPRKGGFFEHYSPTDGGGHGGEQFAWTAALVLDLLLDEEAPADGLTREARSADHLKDEENE